MNLTNNEWEEFKKYDTIVLLHEEETSQTEQTRNNSSMQSNT